mmetsp:Transcript_53953/g.101180  ORF Transcript_53953/g.101180 Transcript_53953/m.101180 type:complete len:205 (-) Transcript_53953:860-1474(-)
MSLKVRSSTPERLPAGPVPLGSRAYANSSKMAAGSVAQRTRPTPKQRPFSGRMKKPINTAAAPGITEKLTTCSTSTVDADENDLRYDGIDVINNPTDMGSNAPALKSQPAKRKRRRTKLDEALFRGAQSAANVAKAHATRRATACIPALKPSARLHAKAPMYIPATGQQDKAKAASDKDTNGDGAPSLSAKYGAAQRAKPAPVA